MHVTVLHSLLAKLIAFYGNALTHISNKLSFSLSFRHMKMNVH